MSVPLILRAMVEPHLPSDDDDVHFTATLTAHAGDVFVGRWQSERLHEAVDAVLDGIRTAGLDPTRLHRREILDDDGVTIGFRLQPKNPADETVCSGCKGRGFYELFASGPQPASGVRRAGSHLLSWRIDPGDILRKGKSSCCAGHSCF
jgi:hypothetical protein